MSPVRSGVLGCLFGSMSVLYSPRESTPHAHTWTLSLTTSHSPRFVPCLQRLSFTSVGLIISNAMFILESFQVGHTRISDEKLQFVIYNMYIYIYILYLFDDTASIHISYHISYEQSFLKILPSFNQRFS